MLFHLTVESAVELCWDCFLISLSMEKRQRAEENINVINIRMSQKYVGIANLFERKKGGENECFKMSVRYHNCS